MSYQDPWQARRAAKEARRAARYAFKAQRRQNKYAYRSARRAYRYGYGRPGGRIAGMVFLVLLLVFIFTHIWAWLVAGIVIVAAVAVILRLLGGGMPGTWFGSQAPQQPYQP